MNTVGNIYTTVSNRSLHIAADHLYIGKINSYNNCLTRFFAWLFGWSMSVDFDGRERAVDKKSYKNLVEQLRSGVEGINIEEYKIFKPILEGISLESYKGRMRDAISSSDRNSLFERLALAISRGETNKALQMIGKGAELDTPYFDRESGSVTFCNDTDGLSFSSKYKFTVFKASPLLQAARKGNKTVVSYLKKFGANLSGTGKEYTFVREITNVSHNLEVTPSLTSMTHNFLLGNKRILSVEPHMEPEVTTEDSRTNEKKYRFNADTDQIELLGDVAKG